MARLPPRDDGPGFQDGFDGPEFQGGLDGPDSPGGLDGPHDQGGLTRAQEAGIAIGILMACILLFAFVCGCRHHFYTKRMDKRNRRNNESSSASDSNHHSHDIELASLPPPPPPPPPLAPAPVYYGHGHAQGEHGTFRSGGGANTHGRGSQRLPIRSDRSGGVTYTSPYQFNMHTAEPALGARHGTTGGGRNAQRHNSSSRRQRNNSQMEIPVRSPLSPRTSRQQFLGRPSTPSREFRGNTGLPRPADGSYR